MQPRLDPLALALILAAAPAALAVPVGLDGPDPLDPFVTLSTGEAAPATAASSDTLTPGGTYTVRRGDTLSGLGARLRRELGLSGQQGVRMPLYGETGIITALAARNSSQVDASLTIREGQQLTIPTREELGIFALAGAFGVRTPEWTAQAHVPGAGTPGFDGTPQAGGPTSQTSQTSQTGPAGSTGQAGSGSVGGFLGQVGGAATVQNQSFADDPNLVPIDASEVTPADLPGSDFPSADPDTAWIDALFADAAEDDTCFEDGVQVCTPLPEDFTLSQGIDHGTAGAGEAAAADEGGFTLGDLLPWNWF